jgi:peptidoglycan hydrolase-like protein with peptidoglycan-binding domain
VEPDFLSAFSSTRQVAEPDRGRRRAVLWVVVGALIASVGGLVASRFITTPREAVARAAAPPASVITARVERRVLTSDVVLRATVRPTKTITVKAPQASGTGTVVTGNPVKPGQTVRPGQVLVEVSGRPVIALHGSFPSYRDLQAGATGPDVVELQAALRELGYGVRDRPGFFGDGTATAVRSMYRARGYQPPTQSASADPVAPPGGGRPGPGQPASPASTSRLTLPRLEVAYVPSYPALLTTVRAVGDEVTGDVVTLAVNPLIAVGTLSPSDRAVVKPGVRVTVSGDAGVASEGAVSGIGSFVSGSTGGAGGAGATAAGYPVVVTGTPAIDPRLSGKDVQLRIHAASTGQPVLVVPSSAIYATAAGTTQVIRRSADGAQERIDVDVGASADGYDEVRPTRGDLAEGDMVVVGR